MSIVGAWERKRVLITARTYPVPSAKAVEVSCTAGITEDGEWIRLFPVPYRFLEPDKRFKKYQWIELDVAKDSDHRPESHQINAESIVILSSVPTDYGWRDRKTWVQPLQAHCLCCLRAKRDSDGHPTLGFFKPREIRSLSIEPVDSNWTEAEMASLSQWSMFATTPYRQLEKIPVKFFYQVFCDHDGCRGHRLSCTDWEMGQSYRSWTRKYRSEWELAFRQRYEDEMIHKYDTHLFVGTVHNHPGSWIIIGLFYPPK